MLVLSRKTGEEIIIGNNVKLIISRISGNRVTIGMTAPEGVRILRGELDPSTTPSDGAKPRDTLIAVT